MVYYFSDHLLHSHMHIHNFCCHDLELSIRIWAVLIGCRSNTLYRWAFILLLPSLNIVVCNPSPSHHRQSLHFHHFISLSVSRVIIQYQHRCLDCTGFSYSLLKWFVSPDWKIVLTLQGLKFKGAQLSILCNNFGDDKTQNSTYLYPFKTLAPPSGLLAQELRKSGTRPVRSAVAS